MVCSHVLSKNVKKWFLIKSGQKVAEFCATGLSRFWGNGACKMGVTIHLAEAINIRREDYCCHHGL